MPQLTNTLQSQLSIFSCLYSESLTQVIQQCLSGGGTRVPAPCDRYTLTQVSSLEEVLQLFHPEKQLPDCLVLQDRPELLPLLGQLHQQGSLLPLVIIETPSDGRSDGQEQNQQLHSSTATAPLNNTRANSSHDAVISYYHSAVVWVATPQLVQISHYIDQAISQFIHLSLEEAPANQTSIPDLTPEHPIPDFLLQHQRRLAEKLRERLGYLGVYYKRNPQHFFRHLPPAKKQEFLEQLRADYREIVLNYFTKDSLLNQIIDEFVNTAFFSDLPVTQIVEIHMELMDEFSKQLKLEGRSEEMLLDYRLTLIDVLAHLCEMYRRSIPKDS